MLQFIAIAASTFISEDLACIAAGSLAAASELSLTSAIAASLVGIVVGDLLLYAAGFLGGRAILRFRIAARYLSPAKLLSAERWFDQRGSAIVVLSRFVPGMRLPTYVAAGVLRMPVLRFFCCSSLPPPSGPRLWSPPLIIQGQVSHANSAKKAARASGSRSAWHSSSCGSCSPSRGLCSLSRGGACFIQNGRGYCVENLGRCGFFTCLWGFISFIWVSGTAASRRFREQSRNPRFGHQGRI